MELSTIIGVAGVVMLLVAFFLNLFRFISQNSLRYIILNAAGAGLSAYAAVLIHYIPFVVLETVWCLVAIVALFRKPRFYPK